MLLQPTNKAASRQRLKRQSSTVGSDLDGLLNRITQAHANKRLQISVTVAAWFML